MHRNQSLSSSPDPLGGTPRTTTQSTNPDLARSPTPESSHEGPDSPPIENGTSNDSSVPSVRTDPVPGSRQISHEAVEEEEDSRESPSFEGVKFSSSFGPLLSSTNTPKKLSSSQIDSSGDASSPGRARNLPSDRPQAHNQPIRKRKVDPTAASSSPGPGPFSSKNTQSTRIPSTTLASMTQNLPSHHKTTFVTNLSSLDRKGTQQPRVQARSKTSQQHREPPPRSRPARVNDRLATRAVVPPRKLALPVSIVNANEPLGKTSYPEQEEEEDSIEALRNTGPIRSSRKDDLRSESRAYIYGLPGSSTLFGSDFSKASLAEDEEDAGGFDLGDDLGMGTDVGSEGGDSGEAVDGLGDGLTRRRRDGSEGENKRELIRDTETSSQGVRSSISRPRSIVSAGQEASALISNSITSQRPRARRPQRDGLQTVSTSSPSPAPIPSTSQAFPAASFRPKSTQAPITDQLTSEQDIEHRTISTHRAPRRVPSVVYKPRTRRNTAEREVQLSSSNGEEQELPSLEELDLPLATGLQHQSRITKKRNVQAIESEESEEERPKRLATKKRRAVRKNNPIRKARSEVNERTESERKNVEERLKRIKEIDNYELEVDYVV